MSVSHTSSPSLSERLQEVTEALAAVHTPEAVFRVVLAPALDALGALAGAILLVNSAGDRLDLAAAQGNTQGQPSLWQEGVLDDILPASDALRRHQSLFFEHPGDLVQAYPDLEARTGGVAAVATAVLPMFLDEQPLGALILDFKEPHQFTPKEIRFLRTLAAQSATALGRTQLLADLQRQVKERTQHLQANVHASDAFIAFTEAIGTETDFLQLARQAMTLLRGRFPGISTAYYTPDGDLWKAQLWSEDMAPSLVQGITAGLPGSTPLIRQALETRTLVCIGAWNSAQQEIAHSESYGAGAAYPLLIDGDIQSLLLIGLKDAQKWTEPDQALVRAVGRSLNLALERAAQVERQARQSAELDARNRALENFAELTRDLSLETDPYILIQLAQTVALTLLPEGYALYFEPQGDRWVLRGQTGDLRSEGLQAAADRGLPYHEAKNLLIPYESRQPYYQDQYAKDTDNLDGLVAHLGASATLPVLVNGQVRGVFAVVLFGKVRYWSRPDQAVLESVVYSLGLAVERAITAAQLQTRTDEAERRVQALEAFAVLTAGLNVEQDPFSLILQAQEVVLGLLPSGRAGYWELEAGLWFQRVSAGGPLPSALQAFIDAGLPVGRTTSLDHAWRTGEPIYYDRYPTGQDVAPALEQPAQSTALLPVWEGDQIRGVMDFTTYTPYVWQAADRAMLTSVIQSLKLALERARGIQVLAERTAQLEQSHNDLSVANQELEAFGYSASHDLRTPVRHVKGFVTMALRALEQNDITKAVRHLGIVAEAADRMNAMIDALLALSQAGRAELNVRPVALSMLVHQAQQDVRLEFPQQLVEWQVEDLPTVVADPVLLQEVVTNLISNAVKYHHKEQLPRIRIWTEQGEQETALFVQDNGVGFDPHYADKLFGAFQRLHTQQEFIGTGIGLATVRRIVTRHGGRVWAEGRLGEGATFGFSLPR
ncbi:GAF domain-containing protein [Deinococcus sp. Leaf326]|uniref:GAF domain-containing protein n=1 Tax=Deinococcus sp. Leaf326 TaxID=1736338 RepID=UPI0012E241BF|nr:GAF domain-containing protein [Deinococcus sp. Leaf326]